MAEGFGGTAVHLLTIDPGPHGPDPCVICSHPHIVVTDKAGHLDSWNKDPAGYERLVRQFAIAHPTGDSVATDLHQSLSAVRLTL